eukprot:gene20491-biopygen1047
MPFLWVEWSGVRRVFLHVIDRRGPHVRSPQEDASQNSIHLGNRQGPQHRTWHCTPAARVRYGQQRTTARRVGEDSSTRREKGRGRHILTTGSVRPARHHRRHVRRSSTAAGLPCP